MKLLCHGCKFGVSNSIIDHSITSSARARSVGGILHHPACPQASLFLGRKHFLHTDLINKVLASDISQMGSLLLVGQVSPNALGHDQY